MARATTTKKTMINLINPSELLPLVKVTILIAEGLYAIFAFIVVRQTSLMNKTFQTGAGLLLNLFSRTHFFAVLGLFVLTLIIL